METITKIPTRPCPPDIDGMELIFAACDSLITSNDVEDGVQYFDDRETDIGDNCVFVTATVNWWRHDYHDEETGHPYTEEGISSVEIDKAEISVIGDPFCDDGGVYTVTDSELRRIERWLKETY